MSTTRLLVAVALVFGTAAVAAVERRPVTRVADNLNIPYAIGSWEGEDAGPWTPKRKSRSRPIK